MSKKDEKAQETSATSMKASQVSAAIIAAFGMGEPIMIWGPPGVGKSDTIRQAAQALGDLPVWDYRAIYRDPVDVRGIPGIVNEQTVYFSPADLPHGKDTKGILFLDELVSAPPQTQAALYQLTLDRRIAEYVLPEGVQIVAAGNRTSDRGVVHRMPDPLADRFFHIDFAVDLDDWCTWAVTHNVRMEIVAFVRFRPALLHMHETDRKCHAFPTPRSWAKVSKLLEQNPGKGILPGMVAGKVGDGAAAEFMGFLRIWQAMPNIDNCLLNPGSAPLPEGPAATYAVACAMARRADRQNFDRVMQYCERLPAAYQAALMADATKRDPSLCTLKPFVLWASKNA